MYMRQERVRRIEAASLSHTCRLIAHETDKTTIQKIKYKEEKFGLVVCRPRGPSI